MMENHRERMDMKRGRDIYAILAIAAVALGGNACADRGGDSAGTEAETAEEDPAPEVAAEVSWTVGELRPDGLRIVPSGRSDAGAVLEPGRFSSPKVREAYRIATRIPAVLNQLYCWCGCENRGVHRSNLGCFEDTMAVNCDVCRGTAEIAWKMIRDGISDPATIQYAVDGVWAPQGT